MRVTFFVIYYLFITFFFAGFAIHESANPIFLIYSKGYIIGLLCYVFAFFWLIPYLCKKWFGLEKKDRFLSVIPALSLLLVVYLVAHFWHYASKDYLFDIWLQNPPPDFEKVYNINKEKSSDEIRVLCLGGSTTAAQSNKFEEDWSYPKYLQLKLNELYPDKKIVVLNGGTAWYSSMHSFINYVSNYSDYHLDLVIFMHGINDVIRSFSSPEYSIGPYNNRNSHYYGVTINAARGTTFEGEIFRNIFRAGSRFCYDRYIYSDYDYPLDSFPSLNTYDENLRRLAKSCKNDSVPLLVFTQPNMYKNEYTSAEYASLVFRWGCYNDNTWPKKICSLKSMGLAMKGLNEKAKIASLTEGFHFLEMHDGLPKNMEYFRDDVHKTKKGNETLGNSVAEFILSKRLIKN